MAQVKKEDFEFILNCGREMSVGRLADAIESAKNEQEAVNRLGILQVEATHTLATMIYNDVLQSGAKPEDAIAKYCNAVAKEFNFLKSEPMEFERVKFKNNPGGVIN